MGAACCVASRDRTIVNGPRNESLHRNVRYSPSWSFRWDNRGRVAGEVDNNSIGWFSDGISRNDGLDNKSVTDGVTTYASDGGSPLENAQTLSWQKSPISEGTAGKLGTLSSDQSMLGNISTDVSFEQTEPIQGKDTIMKEAMESPAVPNLSTTKLSLSVPSSSSFSTSPMSFQSHHAPSSTPSRWSRHSPGHQLFRQASDNRVPGFKSPNSYSSFERRPSLVLPILTNESTKGSYGGSSDNWSMHAFSELMASSHRERWSFDSDSLGFNREKMARSSSRFSASASVDMQTCGICLKLLTEKSSWSGQKIIVSNDLSVVAVLICGHVYHAECLDNITPVVDRFDPACPVCTFGEKQILKLSEKALRADMDMKARNNKRSRNRIVDSDLEGDSIVLDKRKNSVREGKGPKLGSTSSMRASLGKPFFRRHFTFASRGTRSSSPENYPTKKKGFFWSKSSKK